MNNITFTKEQLSIRDECINIVKGGLQTFLSVASAILQLKTDKLFLATHESFKDFCREVLGIEESHAYRLIDAAEVKESLPKRMADKITNERQARALVPVPEDRRVEVIKKAAEQGPLTEKSIRAAAEIILEPQNSPTGEPKRIEKMGKSENELAKNGHVKPVKELDDLGTIIPDDALPFWNRRPEVQELLTQITKIKSALNRAHEKEDPMYANVSNTIIADLTQAYTHLLEAKPYAVCTTCQGTPSFQPRGCSFCRNTGLISKWKWDTQSRKEVKEMRLKSNALRK